MQLLLVLFAVLGCSFAASILPAPKNDLFHDNAMSSRIHGGHHASENQFPHQVSLLMQHPGTLFIICGGSLISNNWVLSAAHCTRQHSIINLRFGSTLRNWGGHAMAATNVINHPNFNPVFLNNDISLIQTPRIIPFSAAIQPIRLPSRGQEQASFNNQVGTMAGWGGIVPGGIAVTSLHWADVRVISNAQCIQSFNANAVVNHVVCTLGNANPNQGTCEGDAGGPLFIVEGGVRTQIGIASFGPPANRGGCASGLPSAYMRTSHFLGWISQHTGIPIRG